MKLETQFNRMRLTVGDYESEGGGSLCGTFNDTEAKISCMRGRIGGNPVAQISIPMSARFELIVKGGEELHDKVKTIEKFQSGARINSELVELAISELMKETNDFPKILSAVAADMFAIGSAEGKNELRLGLKDLLTIQ